MATNAITVRLDDNDRDALANEAERLGIRAGTLARILIRGSLRPSQAGSAAFPLGSPPATGRAGSDPAEVLAMRRDAILRIAASHGAGNVRVFGSTARGSGRPGSDLDLLVELGPGRSLLDLVALSQALEDELGIAVDVLTDDELSPHVRGRIKVEAIPI